VKQFLQCMAIGLLIAAPPFATAQTDSSSEPATSEADTIELLTQAELENLVAPIALYPDTLLIQVLVAATYPLQVVKANEFATTNTDLEGDARETAITSQGYDESVAVLATAFPDVLLQMTAHIDWTDSIGTAMLAQSDDVLAAVQTMRNQAINSGALISGPEQTVSVDEDAVIVQPTDPEVVYVPQYNTETVYVQDNSNNTATNIFMFFATVALIDNIFNDNNYWHGYWGCRNCGGWNGRPIYRDPRVNIGKGGNVIVGNEINIGGGDRGPGGSWKPEPKRQKEAQNKIAKKRGPDGATKMPTNRPNSRGDDMRQSLTKKTGVADISRDRGNLSGANRPSARPSSPKRDAVARTGQRPTQAKPPVRKPSARPAARQPAARAPSKRQPSAMKQRAPAKKSRAASSRGRSGGGGKRGRR
jgi:hypothetical protein